MQIAEFIKDIAVPLISVATAVMVGVLNHQVNTNEAALKERDQRLQERIGELDLMIKKTREEREERESNQNFNLRIYDIVTKSLEEADPKKQEAASAFVIVMVDEPLRSSLLNVLKQGAAPAVKEKVGYIIAQEKKYQSDVATTPQKKGEVTPSYNWGEWDFDIFWCSTSGDAAKQQAEVIGEQLLAEGSRGRVRIRELPESINVRSGYQIEGYTIRRNSNEKETADALGTLAEKALAQKGVHKKFSQSLTTQNTPWYISAFVCPAK